MKGHSHKGMKGHSHWIVNVLKHKCERRQHLTSLHSWQHLYISRPPLLPPTVSCAGQGPSHLHQAPMHPLSHSSWMMSRWGMDKRGNGVWGIGAIESVVGSCLNTCAIHLAVVLIKDTSCMYVILYPQSTHCHSGLACFAGNTVVKSLLAPFSLACFSACPSPSFLTLSWCCPAG